MRIAAGAKSPAKEVLIDISDFKGGSNNLIDEARMPTQFAVSSENMIQVQDGLWKTKWGTTYYGATWDANPDGASEFVKSDGTTELIVIANGTAYRSTNGGTATAITGATFTAGIKCYFMQIAGYLYIANGTDNLARYDGSVLTTYSSLAAPANLSGARVASGLSSGTYTYYAEVTALNDVGETVGSTEASITVNKSRDAWVAATDKGITWSWDAVVGATRYQLYISEETGQEVLLTSIPAGTVSFTDDGTLQTNDLVVPPLSNTTNAPKFISMCISDNRIWATNDSTNMYTVYWSGTGQQMGKFSDFYGGGYINLERGGRELPVAVKHYQSGSGQGRATVLCRTPDGKGAVWQISIDSLTVGDTTFAVPTAAKIVGSFGTESVNGVVQTTNDIAFPNRKGWFSLGARPNYYGLLRTAENSSNIRPYWRSLIGSQISGICAYFYDAKIFISVPQSTTGNDRIIVYDTERSNWACDWSGGAKQFLEYTDTDNKTHFLFIPTTGTRLIELSENTLNDLGTAFNQTYISPLIPVSKTKTDILNLREAIVELGRPRGVVKFQILGIGKDSTFATLATKTITSFGATTGVGSDMAGDFFATSTNDNSSGGAGAWAVYFTATPSVFTQATVKAAIRKRAKVYAIQFKVYSTTADTDFTILSLQAKGRLLPRRLPSQWVN